ncbi:MAG: RNA-binding S4 domain-containing protein [Ruminococcus sp.]|nr:RNA-binding S4 domain-containing protein [Ruminococcus sp.]
MRTVEIHTEYIKFDQLLKFAGILPTGAEAKAYIQQGNAKLDGEVCTMRNKKIRDGAVAEAMGEKILVKYVPAENVPRGTN